MDRVVTNDMKKMVCKHMQLYIEANGRKDLCIQNKALDLLLLLLLLVLSKKQKTKKKRTKRDQTTLFAGT